MPLSVHDIFVVVMRVFFTALGDRASLSPHTLFLAEHVRARVPGRVEHDCERYGEEVGLTEYICFVNQEDQVLFC